MPDFRTPKLLFSFSLTLFVSFCFLVRFSVPFPAYLVAGAFLGAGWCRVWLSRLEAEAPLMEAVASRLKLRDAPPLLGCRPFYYLVHVLAWSLAWPGILVLEVLKHPFPSLRGDLD